MEARGNSGIIFAHFLHGFANEVTAKAEIDLPTFIAAVKKSSDRVHEVILNPVEGTLLTIIKSWARSLEQHYEHQSSFDAFIAAIMADLKAAVDMTPSQLPILKAKGVVDSGAKGFYHFMIGIQNYISKGNAFIFPDADPVQADDHPVFHETSTTPPYHRFCCEAMLCDSPSDLMQVKTEMMPFGDSLVVAGGHGRLRIHLHTNSPEAFFSKLQTFGTLSQIKADDMMLQHAVVAHRQSRIAIVTDSIADLPKGFDLQHQVFVLPLHLEVNGVDHLDRISLSVGRFYELNENLKEQPKSSLPSIKQVESLLDFLTTYYEGILMIHVSDKLSGTYNMVASVAETFKGQGVPIKVINTLTNSGAQGLLVQEACKMARMGLSLSEISVALDQRIPLTKILVAVDTVRYLARSGRVSHRMGKLAQFFKIKPIMTIDPLGYGKAYGASISMQKVLSKLKRQVLKDHHAHGIESFNIVHAACPERAEVLAHEIGDLLNMPVSYLAEISPIVGAVSGEGAIAVSYIMKSR